MEADAVVPADLALGHLLDQHFPADFLPNLHIAVHPSPVLVVGFLKSQLASSGLLGVAVFDARFRDSVLLLSIRVYNEQAYRLNPGFKRFVDQSGLPFAPRSKFKKVNLDSRQDLYGLLAEMIWDPEVMARIKEGSDH